MTYVVGWKHTRHFFHMDVVHMCLFKWIGLGRFTRLLFRALISKVARLIAPVAGDMGEIPLSFWVVVVLSIVAIASIVVSIDIIPLVIPIRKMCHVASTALRRVVFLVRGSRVMLSIAKLPLTVLFLHYIIVQSDSLVK